MSLQTSRLTGYVGLVAWPSTGTGTVSRTKRSDRHTRWDVRSQRLGVLYPRRQTGYLRRCRRGSKGNALCANAAAGGRDCVQRCCCCCSSHCERQPNARHHIYRRPSFWPCSRPSSRSSGWRFGTRAGGTVPPISRSSLQNIRMGCSSSGPHWASFRPKTLWVHQLKKLNN